MDKLADIKKYLQSILATAKKLGLDVVAGGGYASSIHNINNLPKYPVSLLGAISLIEGMPARDVLNKRFRLTFDETMALELGFNGREDGEAPKAELEKLGAEISNNLFDTPDGARKKASLKSLYAALSSPPRNMGAPRLRGARRLSVGWDEPIQPLQAAPLPTWGSGQVMAPPAPPQAGQNPAAVPDALPSQVIPAGLSAEDEDALIDQLIGETLYDDHTIGPDGTSHST